MARSLVGGEQEVVQPSIHHEMTVSTLASNEVQHSVFPNINVKNVDLGVLITPKHPKGIKPSAAEKEVSAHLAKSTKVAKTPTQQEVPPKHPNKIQ